MRIGRHVTLKPLQPFAETKLSGAWFVRSMWLLVTLFGVSILMLTLPELWRTLTTVCTTPPFLEGQPTASGLAVLALIGLSLGVYSVVTLTMNLLLPIVIIVVMSIVLCPKPQDRVVVPP